MRKKPQWPQDLVERCIRLPAFMYTGVRKIVQNLTYEIKSLPDLTYSDLGYGKNKHKQLCRNYWNQPDMERVKKILEHRKNQTLTSVALSMRASEKESRSQGHCMQTMVITKMKEQTVVEMQYRSTELILKFGGDLVFLPHVFEELNIEPTKIRFHFANAYLSGVFFPTLSCWWDPIKFLDYLWENDQRLFAAGTRFFLRSAYKKDQHFPYSPEQQQHRFAWERLDMPRIKEYLEKKHLTYNKPLPKIHHKKVDYVPRGKRS